MLSDDRWGLKWLGESPWEEIMKSIMLVPFLVLAAACAAEPPMEAAADVQSLSEALAGRVAGEPQSCVRQTELTSNRSIGGRLVFGTRNRDLVYVSESDCPELTQSRALKTRSTIGSLCAGDIVEVFDPVAGIPYGSCPLGQFTPYRRSR
jgi:hypothetical protein